MKLENKTPTAGSFTVESDRAIMETLSFVASSITNRIDRGISFSVLAGHSSSKTMAVEEQV